VVATSGNVGVIEENTGLPTIGRPIRNTQIHILDDDLNSVSLGEPGQMFIGGASLARGYLNRPDLTAERFLPNPFDATPGSRMYRTGDIGRILANGEIVFMGRIDDQVKIRGFRIEPDEIAAVLNEDPSVEQSVVVARALAGGEKSLVAYIVLAPGAMASQTELKLGLGNRLPDYMVPPTFVQLDSLPLLASGKVDRAALPAPTAENTLRDDEFVAPRTPIEERVAEIVGPLLGLERVSVDDNFFMLGGHSLLGTQLIARIRDTFGINPSLRNIFESPTIADLADLVEGLLLDQLDAMSEEEAANALDSQNNDILEGV
jgi:acyl carrier protein